MDMGVKGTGRGERWQVSEDGDTMSEGTVLLTVFASLGVFHRADCTIAVYQECEDQ